MGSGQVRAVSAQVGQGHAGHVHPSTDGQRQGRGHVEGVGGVDAAITGVGQGLDRTIGDIAGGVDDLTHAGNAGGRRHRQVGLDDVQFAAGGEAPPAGVIAGAQGEKIAMAQQLAVARGLDRRAERAGIGPGTVDGAVGNPVAQLVLAADQGRTADGDAGGVEDLEGGRGRADGRGKGVVLGAQGPEQRVGGAAGATFEIAVIAVHVLLAEQARVQRALHRPAVGQGVAPIQPHLGHLVSRGLRIGIDGAQGLAQQVHRGGADHAQSVAPAVEGQVQLARAVLPADIAIDARHAGARGDAPAVLASAVDGQIGRPWTLGQAVFGRAIDPPKGAALDLGLAAVGVQTGLHGQADRAAQGVQAEGRTGGEQLRPADGGLGDQVPVDRVAEGLVQTRAVHIDGQAFGRALQGRGLEAAEIQVAGEGIALGVRQADARRALLQGVDGGQGPGMGEVAGAEDFHRARQLVGVQPRAGQGRRSNDDYFSRLGRRLGPDGARRRGGQSGQSPHRALEPAR